MASEESVNILPESFFVEFNFIFYTKRKLNSEIRSYVYKTRNIVTCILTLRLLMSYIYGAPSKVRNANVVYTWT